MNRLLKWPVFDYCGFWCFSCLLLSMPAQSQQVPARGYRTTFWREQDEGSKQDLYRKDHRRRTLNSRIFFFLMAVLVVVFSALFRVEKLKVWKDHLDWFNWLQLVVERKIIPNEAFFLAWKPRLFISTCTVGNMVLKAAALFYSAF